MLYIIESPKDRFARLISDDPVRPEILPKERINDHSKIFVLLEDKTYKPLSVVCVKFLDKIPSDLDELLKEPSNQTIAVFYTIWSYSKGMGSSLISEAKKYLESNHPQVKTYVTFSPQSEQVKKFHLKNGASVYRENKDSVNYLY